jgi:hypothetical protein
MMAMTDLASSSLILIHNLNISIITSNSNFRHTPSFQCTDTNLNQVLFADALSILKFDTNLPKAPTYKHQVVDLCLKNRKTTIVGSNVNHWIHISKSGLERKEFQSESETYFFTKESSSAAKPARGCCYCSEACSHFLLKVQKPPVLHTCNAVLSHSFATCISFPASMKKNLVCTTDLSWQLDSEKAAASRKGDSPSVVSSASFIRSEYAEIKEDWVDDSWRDIDNDGAVCRLVQGSPHEIT